MLYRGACPHCSEPIVWSGVPPAAGTCRACGRELLVTVPENASETIEVVVLPRLASRPGWLEAHGLRRPARMALAIALVLGLAAFLLGLAHLFAPESSVTKSLTHALGILVGLTLAAVPLLGMALVSALVIRRASRAGLELPLWGSTRAIWAGAMVLIATVTLGTNVPEPRTIGFALDVLGWLLAGWVTARLAPRAPFRHATGVALIHLALVVAALFFLSWLVSSDKAQPLVPVVAIPLLTVFLIFLGAWLGRPPARRPA